MSAAPAAPFESLARMQEEHAAVVKEVGTDVLADGNPGRVAELMRRGVATGRVLDAKDDRAAAQSLINFWAARLTSAVRDASRKRAELRAAGPEAEVVPAGPTPAEPPDEADPGDTLLEEFDPAIIGQARAAADAWLSAQPDADRTLARRIMLRLVRLRPDGTAADPVPTVRAALYDLDARERVNAILGGLATAGVVRITPGDSPEMDRVSLRSADLLRDWGAYAGWVRERVRVRESADEWARRGNLGSLLVEGEGLEEVRAYHDRNRTERDFTDASRDRERRKNEWNRRLKWVFGGLAVATLIGWIAAGVNYYRVKGEARVTRAALGKEQDAKTAEAKANDALRDEQKTLRQKQQLTNLRLLVRGVAELASAHTLSEREIAGARWDALSKQFNEDPEATAFWGDDLRLAVLRECAVCQEGPGRLPADDIRKLRRLRNPIVANPAVYPALKAMRDVSFAMAKESADRTVQVLDAGRPFVDAEPFVKEFWTQYWGEMILVEGPRVEKAMVAFGAGLAAVRADIDRPDADMTKKLEAVARKYPAEKGKQLTQTFSDVRLNTTSLARLAADLRIPRDEVNKLLREATDRRVSNPKLVEALKDLLKPLIDAMKEELKDPIQPYTEAVGR